jgi:DNA-directed RNA polymerase specialized sigma24 family protein
MTTSYPLAAPLGARELLGDATVRARLAAMVRRRVPHGEAEDVVQSVLCDALAAERIPADAVELSRWISVIARHKIADFHRRARRESSQDVPEQAVPPAPFEARALLHHVVHDTPFDARGRQALDWVVREHAGEALETIAREAALPSAQVRKRVSRLRARLRLAWLGDAAAVAMMALAFGAVAAAWRAAQTPTAIVAEPSVPGPSAALGRIQGAWHVEAMTTDPTLDGALRTLAEAQAPSARVEIDGRRMTVHTRALTRERFLDVREEAGGRWSVEIADGAGGSQQAEAELRPDGRLVVRAAAGRWRGTVTLAR